MDYLISRLLARGTQRGLQGSQFWIIVAIVAGTARVLRRISRTDRNDVYWRQVVKPGDRFEVVISDSKSA